MPYEVSTPVFEGPFDLLLHLIAKEQVNLFEVSIARIVDAFLAEIERMEALDLDVATEFLLIAATLIELKLRRLLPERGGVDLDEDLALLEERDLLLAKLLEYQTFRHAAALFSKLEGEAGRSYPRVGITEERFANLSADPLEHTTPEQLRAALARVLLRSALPPEPPKVSLTHVTEHRMSVAEAVDELAQALVGSGRVQFRSLFRADAEPVEVIVRFLAVLELFKQGWIEIDQPTNFGDLCVEWLPEGPGEVGEIPGVVRPESEVAEPTRAAAELSIDDVESDEVEAELDAAVAAAAAERLAASPDQATLAVDSGEPGQTPFGSRPRILVDDYEG